MKPVMAGYTSTAYAGTLKESDKCHDSPGRKPKKKDYRTMVQLTCHFIIPDIFYFINERYRHQ
ncbi:hypothetical protein GXP67_11900 [Rhodocytophaga rosea]|uniref:Uncharacterized protein n=1 Tax=Rhodocytophaga rosea TaxID=2704465 RepID=A0A6C0GH21_9BACT|nr:hypothetical protein [Rhodocytophaga rosea]QHT67288.1 hypothetical protein GXP67_11900 [Rhodocytophaga rosea]